MVNSLKLSQDHKHNYMASYAESLFSGKTQSPFGAAPKVGDQLGIGKGGVMTPEVQASLVKAMETQKAQQSQQAQQSMASTAPTAASVAPKKNIIQAIFDPVADFTATGIRTAQGVGRGIQALGQSAMGDKEAAAETMRKINEDIYKPVNIPLLGQGDVRRIGDVTEKGTIAPSKETLKSLGTAAELASFATPVKGSGAVGNQVFKQTGKVGLAKLAGTAAKYTAPAALSGALASGGATLAETGDLGEAGKSALGGAAFGGVIGTALPKIAGALSKKAMPNLAKAAKINREALALTKGEAKKELVSTLRGQSRNMPLELAKEGIVLKTKEEAGRKVFDVAESVAQLADKSDVLETQLDNLIASRPGKTFNLGAIQKKALSRIDDITTLTPKSKAALKKSITEEIKSVAEANGYKVGDKSAIGASFQIDGLKAQELKKAFQRQARDLYEAKARGGVVSDADLAAEALARSFREMIETQYAGLGDVGKVNKEIGRLAEISKFLQSYEGRIVKGGYLGRRTGGVAGALLSQAIPAPPILREAIGYKVGEKVSDFLDDPTRKMLKASKLASPQVQKTSAVGQAIGGALDKIPDFNIGAPSSLAAGSLLQGGDQQPTVDQSSQIAPSQGKYTAAQIGQRMKAKHPELANFSDEEIGSRLIAKHPELAQIAQ